MDADIQKCRRQIERIDRQIIEKLADRFKYTDLIMANKKALGLPMTDEGRELELLKKHCEQAGLAGVDVGFITSLFRVIFKEAKRRFR